MKKKEIKALLIPAVIVAGLMAMWCNAVGAGIVAVDGYEHGIALCQGYEDSPVDLHGDVHMWNKDGIMYVINEGHLHDPQVNELINLATKECAQYLN